MAKQSTAQEGQGGQGRVEIDADAQVDRVKSDLAAAIRAAALYGFHEGIDNHFSISIPGRSDLFLVNRFGPHWSQITTGDIVTVDLDGRVVDGEGELAVTALMIHRACHQARPAARAVFHGHMPYSTAVAITVDGLDTRLSQNATYFHNRLVRLPYGGAAHTAEEGERIASAVANGATAVLLDNHGALVIGDDVASAWHRLYFLEQAARVQVLAQSTGRELIRMTEAMAAHAAAQWDEDANAPTALFAAVKRQLGWTDV
ncbi:MAG: hypothetical protein H6Q90_1175 [Deltaproteobacteria bacterium]|nr:hypothetical protein [Deltaproteobacteria bacterium]